MNSDAFTIQVPFEIGDIIRPQGFINTYKILDIITIHYSKTKKVEVILQLKDLDFNTVNYYIYPEYKWNLVVCNN